jgi:DNA polymerase III delta subunit
MLLFIYGEDTFRSKKKLVEIVQTFTKKYGSENIQTFDFENDSSIKLYELNNFLHAPSFLSKSQMAVSYNLLGQLFQSSKKNLDFISSLIEDIADNKYFWLVLWENSNQKRFKKVQKLILKITKLSKIKIKEFSASSKKDLVNSGMDYLDTVHISIEKNLLDIIAENCQNTAEFYNILDKLIVYASPRQKIEHSDIHIINFTIKDEKIFDILDNIIQRKRAQLYYNLKKHFLVHNVDPLILFSLVTNQMRKLLITADLKQKRELNQSIGKILKIKPYGVEKLVQGCENFSFKELKTIYFGLQKIDSQIKTGQILSEEALDLMPMLF